MYMMARAKARWTIARARQKFPKLIAMAAREPQAVYRRNKLVATVVNPELGEKIEARPSPHAALAAALAELRRLCAEESYELRPAKRGNRRIPAGDPKR